MSTHAPGSGMFRRGLWRLVGAGVWLVYLESTVRTLVAHAGWAGGVGMLSLAVFSLVYLTGMLTISVFVVDLNARRWVTWAYISALILLALITVPGAADQSLAFAVFISAAAMGTLPKRDAIGVVIVLFLACEVSTRVISAWHNTGDGFSVLLAATAVGFLRTTFERARQLHAAQQELADKAVSEERSRIAKDLHDILGHSLTVITVKAELAERLIDTDPQAAGQELSDVQELSRSALHDVRQTTHGVRGISLAGELAAARQALDTIGIAAELPAAVDHVPHHWRELFAWTIREAVTNVVRHSGATLCRIECGHNHLAIADDGAGLAHTMVGNGLAGMRQRAEHVGAVLTIAVGIDGRGIQVRLDIPDNENGPHTTRTGQQETHG